MKQIGIHLRRILAVVVFITLFFVIYSKVSWVLQNKVREDDAMKTFYKYPKNTYDVVFVGTSHVYYGIYPMQIWNEYGFTSYDLASPAQSMACSYYLIKDVIRYQHPKVIVLDTYYLVYNRYAKNDGHLHEVTDAMPLFSPNRLELIRDIVPKVKGNETVWSFYANIALYHSRWEELSAEDFYRKDLCLRGAHISKKVKKIPKYNVSEERKPELPKASFQYLEKIVQYCKDKDTELLLITIPYSMKSLESTQKHLANFNTLKDYAAEQEVPYLNLFKKEEEMEFDYEHDFKEYQHVNCYGAAKITSYLGEYLKQNYDITDHRSEGSYESWNHDYELFKAKLKE